MGKLLMFKNLLKTGRLALRLARDHRVPLYPKLVLGLALLYVLSPLDFIPDWIPVLGQLDDLAALAAGLTLFIRLCPPAVVEEHETVLGYPRSRTIEGEAREVGGRS
jgi:uncharacterized membrane protein YkvA (DUF1232 family)